MWGNGDSQENVNLYTFFGRSVWQYVLKVSKYKFHLPVIVILGIFKDITSTVFRDCALHTMR